MRRGFEGIFGQIVSNPSGKNIYVDRLSGRAGNGGTSWSDAMLTMAAAFAVLDNNDVIYVRGRVVENLTTPAKREVTIVGVGNTPRAGGAEWRSATHPDGDAPLTVIAQGWRVVNMMFRGTTTAPAIALEYDADTKWPNKFSAYDCEFQGGIGGLWDTGGTNLVKIIGCEFNGISTASGYALKSVNTAIAIPLWWTIKDCTFRGNTADIGLSLSYSVIEGNRFLTPGSGSTNRIVSTTFVDEQGDYNQVIGNYFNNESAEIKNDNGFAGGTNDMWANHAKGTAALIVESPPAAS